MSNSPEFQHSLAFLEKLDVPDSVLICDADVLRAARLNDKLHLALHHVPVDSFILTLLSPRVHKWQPVEQVFQCHTGGIYLTADLVPKVTAWLRQRLDAWKDASPLNDCALGPLLTEFARQHAVPIFTTVPSLVQYPSSSSLGHAGRFYQGPAKSEKTFPVESFATFCTQEMLQELRLMLHSLKLFHPQTPIYVIGDKAVCEALALEFPDVNCAAVCNVLERQQMATWFTSNPANRSRSDQHGHGIYAFKTLACEAALTNHPNVVYCDADLVFLAPFPDMPDCDAAMALHGSNPKTKADNEHYGQFNAGLVYCRKRDFLGWWKSAYFREDGFVDQKCLDWACDYFDIHILPRTCNFGHWRMWNTFPGQHIDWFNAPGHELTRFAGISVGQDGIRMGHEAVQSFHVHMINDISKLHPANAALRRMVQHCLGTSEYPAHKELFRYYSELPK